MKISIKHYLAFILLLGFNQTLVAQETTGKIWVTIENAENVPQMINEKVVSSNDIVQALMDQFNAYYVEQAVPSSRQEKLLQVYEITCACDAEAFSRSIEATSKELTAPEVAPEYKLMNTPDDYSTSFTNDYALDLIDAEGAWAYSTGDASIVIGISDANYFLTHEEFVDEVVYVDPTNNHTNYYHGTAVALTAAGKTNNSVGKSAIGYDCKLSLNRLSYDAVLERSYAGDRVINMSWASGCAFSAYGQAIIDETYANGTILVAAAGNGGTCGGAANLVYPASFDHVISVSSVGPSDNHERFIGDPASTHQHNSLVDICAPGYDVALSIAPGSYLASSGTSFASPYVSGTIGLMLAIRPCLTYEKVLAILKSSADNIDQQNPAYANLLGAGRLNANNALEITSMMSLCDTLPVLSSAGNTSSSGYTYITANEGGNDTGSKFESDESQLRDLSEIENQGIERTDLLADTEISVNALIYPNPSEGSAILSWDVRETMKLTVIDVRGVVVYQEDISSELGQTTIDIKEKGIYFIHLEKDGQQKWFGKLTRM
ncbi:MAG: subtilisin family serine protease [Crocinitomicaceae bacterium]|jgi:subtilisin family serine protease